jgi:hypothetical protein
LDNLTFPEMEELKLNLAVLYGKGTLTLEEYTAACARLVVPKGAGPRTPKRTLPPPSPVNVTQGTPKKTAPLRLTLTVESPNGADARKVSIVF